MAGEVIKACITCKYLQDGKGCTHQEKAQACLGKGLDMEHKLWEGRQVRKDSGADGKYYEVDIAHPKSGKPYRAECQDIIEALGMDFNEGNAFKALWRRCAARALGKVKKGNEDPLYDAQKIEFYGNRILLQEENK